MIYFLKAKNWQLFLWVVGLPLLFGMYFTSTLFSFLSNQNPYFSLWPLFASVFISWIFWAIWMWTVGHYFYKKLPEKLDLNINAFRISLILPTVFIIVFLFFISYGLEYTIETQIYKGGNGSGAATGVAFSSAKFYFQIILGSNFLSIFQILFALYFCAKVYKSVEMKKEAHLSDYLAEIVLFCFYFVGIFFIQPRINAYYFREDTEGEGFNDESILDI